MTTETLEKPAAEETAKRRPSIFHKICRCQIIEPGETATAICGTKRPIAGSQLRWVRPKNFCVVCADLLSSGNVRCPVCGKIVR
jgi:hypothetical protein